MDLDKTVIYSEELSDDVQKVAIKHAKSIVENVYGFSTERAYSDDHQEDAEELLIQITNKLLDFLNNAKETETKFFEKRGVNHEDLVNYMKDKYKNPEEFISRLEVLEREGQRKLD